MFVVRGEQFSGEQGDRFFYYSEADNAEEALRDFLSDYADDDDDAVRAFLACGMIDELYLGDGTLFARIVVEETTETQEDCPCCGGTGRLSEYIPY